MLNKQLIQSQGVERNMDWQLKKVLIERVIIGTIEQNEQ